MKQFAMKMDPMKYALTTRYFLCILLTRASLSLFLLRNRGAAGDNHFHAFRTNNYKFHFYETKSGLRLLLTTEPGCSDLHEHLRIKIHEALYIDGVLKRTSAEANAPFESDTFREGLIEWGKRLEYS